MKLKHKLLQKHKNPIGLILRLITYIAIGIAIWYHNTTWLFLLMFIDVMNWLFMPIAKPKNENKFLNKIIRTEMEWLEKPLTFWKLLMLVLIIASLVSIMISLWFHNLIVLVSSIISFSVMKHFITKPPVDS